MDLYFRKRVVINFVLALSVITMYLSTQRLIDTFLLLLVAPVLLTASKACGFVYLKDRATLSSIILNPTVNKVRSAMLGCKYVAFLIFISNG